MIPWIRSLIFVIGYLFIGLIITPIILIPSLPLSHRAFRRVVVIWCSIILGWLRLSTGIRYEIKGEENIECVKEKPHVIISNHQSAFETLLFSKILPDHAFILKKELLHIPFFGWGLRKAKQIAIDRKDGRRSLKKIIEQSEIASKEGRSIIIFPEGTRVTPGEVIRYQSGGFAIAKKLNQPILPIAHNAGLAWPKGHFIKRAGIITVTIGAPIPIDEKSSKDLRTETESWIRTHTPTELKK